MVKMRVIRFRVIEGPKRLIRAHTLCTSHLFLVKSKRKLARYMRRIRTNNREIRIAGSSCRPLWEPGCGPTYFYLGIIWVGISLARFWYVLGCLLWHMTRLKFLLNFSPQASESEFRKLGNFCLCNPKSWALESGIQDPKSNYRLKPRI